MAIVNPGALCDLCRGVLEELEQNPKEIVRRSPFHEDQAALQRSLDAHCRICQFFEGTACPFRPHEISVMPIFPENVIEWSIKTKHYDGKRPIWLPKHCIYYLLKYEVGDALLRCTLNASAEGYTGSHAVLNMAQTWLDRCTGDHAKCRST